MKTRSSGRVVGINPYKEDPSGQVTYGPAVFGLSFADCDTSARPLTPSHPVHPFLLETDEVPQVLQITKGGSAAEVVGDYGAVEQWEDDTYLYFLYPDLLSSQFALLSLARDLLQRKAPSCTVVH